MVDPGLLSLFRSEVATHAATIARELEALERDPEEAALDQLSRAAHAIKGAARIVKIAPAEALAEGLGRRFERMRGEAPAARPEPALFEALRGAVELLNTIGELATEASLDQLEGLDPRVEPLLDALREGGAESPAPKAATPKAATPGALAPAPALGPLLTTLPGGGEVPGGGRGAVEEPTLVSICGSMLDLFSGEVELHIQTLNNGLLDLEWHPTDSERLDALMRASHSIKGAARIVKVEPAVLLAHAMEDLFVAAKTGELTIGAEVIDLLLQCADTLAGIGRAARLPESELRDAAGEGVPSLVQAIEQARSGDYSGVLPLAPGAAAPDAAPTTLALSPEPDNTAGPLPAQPRATLTPERALPAVEPAPPAPAPAQVDGDGETVRVSATHLSTMLELASEALVRGRMLRGFGEAQQDHKRRLLGLTPSVDRLQQHLEAQADGEGAALLREVKQRLQAARFEATEQGGAFNQFALEYERLADRLHEETLASRMRPFSDITQGFRRMVRDITRRQGKQARIEIRGREVQVDRDILDRIEAPITHLLRNGLDHGLETPTARAAAGKPEQGQLLLEARHQAGLLMIAVSDDGCGIDVEQLRAKVLDQGLIDAELAERLTDEELYEFIFLPGFTTAEQVTEFSGRGVGMDVVHRVIHEVGGSVRVASQQGQGTRVELSLPVTLSVIRALLVELAGEVYACRLAQIDRCLKIPRDTIQRAEGRLRVLYGGKTLPLIRGTSVLSLQRAAREDHDLAVLVASVRGSPVGIIVDCFRGERDLVVRPLDPRLQRVPAVSAVAVAEDGSPLLLLDVEDMANAVEADVSGARSGIWRISELTQAGPEKKRILVVDDSVTVREEERKILEGRGYAVDVAVDGVDGWGALTLGSYDMVITDVDMPRMNGIELVRRIRDSDRHAELPVLIVSYKDRPEDRQAGLDAGAQHYFTKSDFSDETMVKLIRELLKEEENG